MTGASLAPPTSAQIEFSGGDVAAGRQKAAPCAGCHGSDGNATQPDMPSLAGQPPLYTYYQLMQFKLGRRKNPVMAPFVANLSDEDLRDLAAYYAAQTPVPPGGQADPARMNRGEQVIVQNHCNSCHLPTLAGQRHIPRLAGQQEAYLLKQLRAFKSQTAADADGAMTTAAQPLSDQDIVSVAHYLAHLRPAAAPR